MPAAISFSLKQRPRVSRAPFQPTFKNAEGDDEDDKDGHTYIEA
jgi:hypothetical protein